MTVGAQTYPLAAKKFKDADVDWLVDNIKVVLTKPGYVYSASHEFLSSIVSGDRLATSGNLSSKTTTGGVCDAADVTLSSLTTGQTAAGYAVYKDTGSAATSPLLFFCDENADTSAFSFSTTTYDTVTLSWPNGIGQ